jgi:hypothetical protein
VFAALVATTALVDTSALATLTLLVLGIVLLPSIGLFAGISPSDE